MSNSMALDSFQSQFFGRLLANGVSQAQFPQIVKQAEAQFGPATGQWLREGLTKLAVFNQFGQRMQERQAARQAARQGSTDNVGANSGSAPSGGMPKFSGVPPTPSAPPGGPPPGSEVQQFSNWNQAKDQAAKDSLRDQEFYPKAPLGVQPTPSASLGGMPNPGQPSAGASPFAGFNPYQPVLSGAALAAQSGPAIANLLNKGRQMLPMAQTALTKGVGAANDAVTAASTRMLNNAGSGVQDFGKSLANIAANTFKEHTDWGKQIESTRVGTQKLVDNPMSAVLGEGGGKFFSENKNWLLPLLMGGLGAGVGGGMGGGMGATLGGIGLPLIYMLMQNPEMLSKFTSMFGGGDKTTQPGGWSNQSSYNSNSSIPRA